MNKVTIAKENPGLIRSRTFHARHTEMYIVLVGGKDFEMQKSNWQRSAKHLETLKRLRRRCLGRSLLLSPLYYIQYFCFNSKSHLFVTATVFGLHIFQIIRKINVRWPMGGHWFCIYKLGVSQCFSGHKLTVKYFQQESRPSPSLAALSVKNQDLAGSELLHTACVGASAATRPGSCPRRPPPASNLWPRWISAT